MLNDYWQHGSLVQYATVTNVQVDMNMSRDVPLDRRSNRSQALPTRPCKDARLQVLAGNLSNGKLVTWPSLEADLEYPADVCLWRGPRSKPRDCESCGGYSQKPGYRTGERVHACPNVLLIVCHLFRLSRRGHWQLDVVPDIYLQKTSYS